MGRTNLLAATSTLYSDLLIGEDNTLKLTLNECCHQQCPHSGALGTIFGHCPPALPQTAGKGKVRAAIGGEGLLFLALISL